MHFRGIRIVHFKTTGGVSYDNEIGWSFWDIETSGITIAYTLRSGSYPDYVYTPVYSSAGAAEGKTTAQIQTQSTFTGAGWDFSDGDGDPEDCMMLRELEDYPRLAWQEVFAGDIAGLYGADMVDFAYLANYWGQDCGNPECDRADIDTSGDVGLGDLAAVLMARRA